MPGRQASRQDLTNGFHGVARSAGISPSGLRTLRGTYASHFLLRGTPLLVVWDVLGHSDVRMTERYGHLAPAIPEAHVTKLDEPSPGATPHRRFNGPLGLVFWNFWSPPLVTSGIPGTETAELRFQMGRRRTSVLTAMAVDGLESADRDPG